MNKWLRKVLNDVFECDNLRLISDLSAISTYLNYSTGIYQTLTIDSLRDSGEQETLSRQLMDILTKSPQRELWECKIVIWYNNM